jgi:DNA recombination protein RmuC
VYGFVLEHDADLIDEALRQKVILSSPFSLFAVLGVVRQAVDDFLVERTSDEILTCLAGFTKQWEMFSEKLDKLGAQFATAQKTYDELSGTRRRLLQRQLDSVERLRTSRALDGPAGHLATGTAPERLTGADDVARGPVAVPDVPDLATDDLDGALAGSATDELAVDHVAVVGDSVLAPRPAEPRVARLRPLR